MSIRELFDSNQFPGVNMDTRTAIVGAIGFDINGLTIDEEGKFTTEELSEGLRYLLTTNVNLNQYIERSSASKKDPFFIDAINDPSALGCSINLDFSACSGGGECEAGGAAGDGGELLGLCSICALVCGCCICAGLNSFSTLKSNESRLLQVGKVILSVSVFIISFTISCIFLPINEADVSGYGLWLRLGISLLMASMLTGIISFASKSVQCLPKKSTSMQAISMPKKEILEELQTVKEFLEKGYSRKGDDKTQCKKFIQEVVRYYIYEKSTDKIDAHSESTPSKSSAATIIAMDEMKPSESSSLPNPSLFGSLSFFKSPSITTEPRSNDDRYVPSSSHRSTAL